MGDPLRAPRAGRACVRGVGVPGVRLRAGGAVHARDVRGHPPPPRAASHAHHGHRQRGRRGRPDRLADAARRACRALAAPRRRGADVAVGPSPGAAPGGRDPGGDGPRDRHRPRAGVAAAAPAAGAAGSPTSTCSERSPRSECSAIHAYTLGGRGVPVKAVYAYDVGLNALASGVWLFFAISGYVISRPFVDRLLDGRPRAGARGVRAPAGAPDLPAVLDRAHRADRDRRGRRDDGVAVPDPLPARQQPHAGPAGGAVPGRLDAHARGPVLRRGAVAGAGRRRAAPSGAPPGPGAPRHARRRHVDRQHPVHGRGRSPGRRSDGAVAARPAAGDVADVLPGDPAGDRAAPRRRAMAPGGGRRYRRTGAR